MRTSQAAGSQKRSSIIFEAWGRLVYLWRWAVLAGSTLLLGLPGFALRSGGSLSNGSPGSSSLEAFRAQQLINQQLVSGQPSGTSFLLMFGSKDLSAAEPAFRSTVESALAPIQNDSRVTAVQTPYNAPTPEIAQACISKDAREALVRVNLKHSGNQAISPLALILLLLIFGSVVAAGLPLGVGVLTILAGLAGTFMLARTTDVSHYALNVVTLIGLGVAIDYSLFVVNRFRDELSSGASREDEVAKTVATTGRAITFSGLTMVIGLL